MNFDEAKERLAFHCGSDPRIQDPRYTEGFLSTLRPYSELRRDVMDDVRACFKVVREHLADSPSLDRDLVNSLWGIVHFGRAWAIDPDGMLKRNNLISEHDSKELECWLNDLSHDIAMELDGNGSDA